MSSPSPSKVSSQQDLVAVSTRKAGMRRLLAERKLLLALGAASLLALAALVALVVMVCLYLWRLQEWEKEECRTEQCIQSAAMLLQGLDRSVDPCADFYEYTCGRWGQAHPVNEAHIYNSWFLERQDSLQRQITEVLQVNASESDPKAVVMAFRLHKSCTDTERLEQLGLEPMLELLSNLSLPRGMPTRETAQGWQLARTLAAAQRFISKDVLVEIGLEKDDEKPDNDTLIIHLLPPQGNNPLPESLVQGDPELPPAAELTSKELVMLKISFMARVIATVDAAAHMDEPDYETNVTEVSAAALRLLLTDTQLSSAVTAKDPEGTKPLRTTFRELQEMMLNATLQRQPDEPQAEIIASTPTPAVEATGLTINFTQYLEVLLEGLNATVDVDKDPVLVTDLSYFKNLAAVLARARPDTIQRLVWWKVVETVSPHTVQLFRDMKHTLLSTVYRGLQPTSRTRFCVRAVKTFLHMAVSYRMAVANPLTSTSSKVREMLSDITAAFEELVHRVPWMDAITKKATLDKAAAVKAFIGYPDWLLKPGELDSFYEGIQLAEDQFLWNMLNMKAREVRSLLEGLGPKKDEEEKPRDRWTTDPIEVNAYYSRAINSIGILQVPFYFLGLEALNYGAIGSILGHELTHGFDIEGKEFDKKGLRNSWWRKEVAEEYNVRAQCFVKQYDRYNVTSTHRVNGTLTLAENIADNGGVREAFLGYRSYTRRHGAEPALPGLNHLSHEQLFFLSFANVWCHHSDAQFDALQLRDSHSPARYRVIGALTNFPEFAEVWSCPAGSPMNPKDKCIIW